MKYIWIFSFLFFQLAYSVEGNLENKSDDTIQEYPHYCSFDNILAALLIRSSNPNPQEVCTKHDMEVSEIQPIKYICSGQSIYSTLSYEEVCGLSSMDYIPPSMHLPKRLGKYDLRVLIMEKEIKQKRESKRITLSVPVLIIEKEIKQKQESKRITLSERDILQRPTTVEFVKTRSVDGFNNPIDCFAAPGDSFRIAGLLDDLSTQKTTEIAIIKVTEGTFREMNCPINNYIAVPVDCERNPSQPGTPFSANCDPKLLEQFFGVGFIVN